MMLATLDELKDALGIDPTESDPARDRLLNSSLTQANALIAGYLGVDLSDTDTEHTYTTTMDNGAGYIKLPKFPILAATISSNSVPMLGTDYALRSREGIIEFVNGMYAPYCAGDRRFGQRVTVVYRAGYEDDMPPELKMVCLNIASAIYNMGGSFGGGAATSGAGALKTLTMFDAMSMSFDTGSNSSAAVGADDPSTPSGMLKTWAFILNKHRVNSPVMA
jgi:hypothetical protein